MKCLFEKVCRVEIGTNLGFQAKEFRLCPSSRGLLKVFEERARKLKTAPECGSGQSGKCRGEKRF